MKYLDTISKAHDLVCQARNLLDELETNLRNDTDVDVEVDGLILDWVEALENVEDPLFSGCNIDHINELPEKIASGETTVIDWRDGIAKTVYKEAQS